MKQRPSKIRSLDAVNAWTLAEVGKNRSKKIDKKLIGRKRRALEKIEAKNQIKELSDLMD